MPAKSKEFTYATVCSGIECMSAAVGPLGGWKPVFFSEIEPFPCSLLKHRYPTVPNLGDMTTIKAERIGDEEKWRITNGTDVIELAGRLGCLAGGTPCQDVSVAGKRAGMAEGSGTRSSLAFHFARLCRELQPRWVLWENVPGVLTSNGGRDFAHFVRSIGECGYSLAYRTLDAQYVRVDGLPRAVPQRRRRVWLVGHLGDDWRTPAEILFEPQGVRGDTPPRRVTGKGFARAIGDGSQGADRPLPTNANGGDVMPTLNATDLTKRLTGQADKSGVFVMQPSVSNDTVCFENHQTDARTTESDVAPTMGASRNAQASNNNPLVVAPAGGVVAIDMDKNKPTNADKPVRKGGAGFGVSEKGASYTLTARDQHAVAYAIDSMGSNAMKSKNPKSGCREVECAPTLTTVDPAPVKHQGGMAVVGVFDMGARKTGAGTDLSGASPTILAAHGTDPHAVCIGFNCEAGTHDHTPKDNLGETLAACHKCGVAIGLDRASFNQGKNAKFGFSIDEECAPTVVSKGPGAVSFEPGIAKREGAPHRFSDEVTSTLRSDMGDNLPAVAVDYIVRRLTPLECERLQGLPDGYTKIPYRGKPMEECPDTPRYKALGNGWAVNCARWICQRIQNYDRNHEQENADGNE